MSKKKKPSIKPPKTKLYRGIQTDAGLSTKSLDKLNRCVHVRGLCEGHRKPTEYDATPEAHISYVGKKPTHKIPQSKIKSDGDLHTIYRTVPGKAPQRWWDKVQKNIR